jgi:hypothetical protein
MRDYQLERMKDLNKSDQDFSKNVLDDFFNTEIKDDDGISDETKDLIKSLSDKYINDLINENKIYMKNNNKKKSSNQPKKKENKYNKFMTITMRDLRIENHPADSNKRLSIVAERWHALPKDDKGKPIWEPPSDEELREVRIENEKYTNKGKNKNKKNNLDAPIVEESSNTTETETKSSKILKTKKKSIKKGKKTDESEQSD